MVKGPPTGGPFSFQLNGLAKKPAATPGQVKALSPVKTPLIPWISALTRPGNASYIPFSGIDSAKGALAHEQE
jgi:hypothetical protein